MDYELHYLLSAHLAAGFFFDCYRHHRDLHSFPTRRSSDLYGLTKVWALEFAKLGVTVNVVAPMAKTRMTEDIAQVPDEMKPEQISPMVLFLCSDLAKDVNEIGRAHV